MGNLTTALVKETIKNFDQSDSTFNKIFIETGTYTGKTCINVSDFFDKLYTIEISSKYFSVSSENFHKQNIKNIDVLLGDSTNILPVVLKNIDQNVFFWLDGHWSMGDTGKGEKHCPLLEECQAIMEYCKSKKKKSIIMIDDIRIFGTNDGNLDWSSITKDKIISILGNSSHYYEKNDILSIFIDFS